MLPDKWREFLLEETKAESFARLEEFLAAERARYAVFPPEEKVYRAFSFFPPEETRVVILGQDPYHEPGQAEGLAFSVPDTVKTPPSLRNIKKELELEFGKTLNGNSLIPWARQGVL
ncbi:uracil-DNA glycosylase, partial [bacterium]|nr:uracil-DNA glycosylase [bacterium]